MAFFLLFSPTNHVGCTVRRPDLIGW